jgi:hypothetical protein
LSVDVSEAGSKRRIDVELRASPIKIEAGEYDWVCVNPGRSSFSRTLYRGKWLGRLKQAAREGTISDLETYAIINDMRALAEIGAVKYEELLGFLEGLDGQVGNRKTKEAIAAFEDIWGLLPENAAVKAWGMKFHQRLLQVVGAEEIPGESASILGLRIAILWRLGDDGAK